MRVLEVTFWLTMELWWVGSWHVFACARPTHLWSVEGHQKIRFRGWSQLLLTSPCCSTV